MKILLSVLASFAFILSLAQEETPEFGDVTLADFGPTPFDSVSSSVVLFDKGTYGGTSYEPIVGRHVRVKIITKEAFGIWGDFRLGSAYTRAKKVKAATYYLEDGKIISSVVEKDAVLVDRKSNTKVVSLTNLREGCIIELSYVAERNYFLMPSWIIQGEAPVLWSEYQLLAPAKLIYLIRGAHQPALYEPKYKRGYSRWVFKNIPAFKKEPFMPHPTNYFARIEFWNRSDSWDKFNDDYLRQYRLWRDEFHYDLAKIKIKKLTDTVASPLDRIKTITRYIKDNFQWNEYWDHTPDMVATVFDERKGSSGELNILLYALLQAAELNPDFVLISTRDNGFILKDYASENQFDYVLCSVTVDGKRYFLDATDPALPFNIVPEYCVNTEGLLISDGGSNWIKIEGEVKEKISMNAWLSVSGNENLKGKITTAKQGYAAIAERRKFNTLGETKFKEESVADNLWIVDSIQVHNAGKTDLPFMVTHYATVPGHITAAQGKIYVNPYMLWENKNLLHGNTREYPIDLESKIEKRLAVNLSIPAGFKIESLPKSQTIALPDKSLNCSFVLSSDDKNIMIILIYTVAKTWFEKEDYANLREFMNMVIAKQNEMIVLVKTGG
ncbi:MAG TPA: DUF3857 domain-containing protein [Chryseosolibacter sp.]|nr:DUF3857 domain-containing protein [Chryseosolibacter sp.]